MTIKIGSENVNKVYIGGSEVNKIYLGETQIYPDILESNPIVIEYTDGTPYATVAAGTYSSVVSWGTTSITFSSPRSVSMNKSGDAGDTCWLVLKSSSIDSYNSQSMAEEYTPTEGALAGTWVVPEQDGQVVFNLTATYTP